MAGTRAPARPRRRPPQINQDLPFQRRTWQVERVGWFGMGLLLAAGLAGAFGSGWLSSAAGSGAGGLEIRYERFQRHLVPSLLEIRTTPGAAGESTALRLGGDFVDRVQIDAMLPQPDQARLSREGLDLRWPAAGPGAPVILRIRFTPRSVGRLDGEIGPRGGTPVRFTVFVYP